MQTAILSTNQIRISLQRLGKVFRAQHGDPAAQAVVPLYLADSFRWAPTFGAFIEVNRDMLDLYEE